MTNEQNLMKQLIDKFIDAQEQLGNIHRKIKYMLISTFPNIEEVEVKPITVYCYECGELDDMFTENGMRIVAYTDNPQKLIEGVEQITKMHCVRCKGHGTFDSKGVAEEISYTMEFIVE